MSELEEVPELLHYYCSSSTLLSILRNQRLWLTAITLSNDRMEGYYAIERYVDLFKPDDYKAAFGARSFMRTAVNGRAALGVCFSEAPDLLSQWRGYAAGGRGLCVSFRSSHLKASVARLAGAYPHLQLAKIAYPSTLPAELVAAIHNEFGDQIDQARKSDGRALLMAKDYGNGGHDRETNLVSRLFSIKNPAFKEEREWRLLLVNYHSAIQEMKFRASNDLLSPYVEIPLTLDAVASVRLGPLHPTPVGDVEKLLRTFSVDASVQVSSASYTVR